MTKYKCPKCNASFENKIFTTDKRYCRECNTLMIASCYKRPDITGLKERIKVLGRNLTINANDKDNQFGSRHAEDYDNNEKINLDSGEIQNVRTKKIVGKLKEKELMKIKSKSRFFKPYSS